MTCPSSREPSRRSRNHRWRNFLQSVDISVDSYWEPESVEDVVWIVQQAEIASKQVHVVGAGYSFEDIAASNEWMIDLKRLNRRISGLVDDASPDSPLVETWRDATAAPSFRLVHVEAGIRLFDLCTQLARENLGPMTVGGALGQTLAGATQTSTHGSAPSVGPLCDQIQAVHLVSTGGQEYWIERESTPITNDDEAVRRAISSCPDLKVVRNDDLFNSVIVSAGRFGVIYAMVFMVVSDIRVAEYGVSLNTADVLRKLPTEPDGEHGFFAQLDTILADPPASIGSGIRNVRSRRYIDIIMNSRRPHECIVRRRWETSDRENLNLVEDQGFLCDPAMANGLALAAQNALEVFATAVMAIPVINITVGPFKAAQAQAKALELLALAANPHVSGGEVLAKSLNAMWDVQFENMLEEGVNLVTDFAWNESTKDSRESGRVGLVWEVAAGTEDPSSIGTCYRGNSIEVVFRARSREFKEFVNLLVHEAPNHRQAGYISIRFTKGSDALLSMYNDGRSQKEIFATTEVTSLADLQGNDQWFRWLEQTALRLGGRLHWGQQNSLNEEQVRSHYSETIDQWKEECAFITGSSTTFSNAYTRQRGLEPIPSPGPGWRRIGSAYEIVDMTAIVDGTFPAVAAVTRDGRLLLRAALMNEASWSDFGLANNVAAIAAVENTLFAATQDDLLLARDSLSADAPWSTIGRAGDCIAMTSIGNRLFALTGSNTLWARDAVREDRPWTRVDTANNCVAITALEGGSMPALVGVGADGKMWIRLAATTESRWQEFGPGENIVAIAAVGALIFAVTQDGRLWTRVWN